MGEGRIGFCRHSLDWSNELLEQVGFIKCKAGAGWMGQTYSMLEVGGLVKVTAGAGRIG